MKTTVKLLALTLFIFLSGCALTYKINRHFSQGEQVYIQRKNECCQVDRFGEILEQPHQRDSTGHILYRVQLPNGWIMPYSEKTLDSLNNWY